MINQTQLNMAGNGAAWKTSTMRGYLFKTTLAPEIYGTEAFTLTFREAENNNGDPVDYVFYFNVDSATLTAYNTEHRTSYTATDSTSLKLKKELLLHILNSQWLTGTQSEYEAVRSGTGEW